MDKTFKEIIEESKKSLEYAENKIEVLSDDFNKETGEVWIDLKKHFSNVNDKLKVAYDDFESKAELKGHLGMMEARDKVEQIKHGAEEFAQKVSKKTKEVDLDTMALKAHLAKMDGEDLWDEKQKEFSILYKDSKVEAEELAKKAGKEINDIFLKLTNIL